MRHPFDKNNFNNDSNEVASGPERNRLNENKTRLTHNHTYIKNPLKQQKGGVCMKGSIGFEKDRGTWCVYWHYNGRVYKIRKYKGEPLYHKDLAAKCLALIQADWENFLQGLCTFRIEKYTGTGWTDVIEYFQDWLEVKKKKKPATYKGYKSYFDCWIQPFFKKYPVMLHEIQLDTLEKLLDSIQLSGKGKYNVMNCFHSFMDYAWRSRRIPEMPPFPKKDEYGIVEKNINWLHEDSQMTIINAIPEEHRSIFSFLKYHFRRPAEACAIKCEDYDVINGVFNICRSISARQLVNSTKTNAEHSIPCAPEFEDVIQKRIKSENWKMGEFIFQNPRARKPGKRYTIESLNIIWKQACKKVNIGISLYEGLKHSSCSQLVNDIGYSLEDVKQLTDHSRMESVLKYVKMNVSRKRQLMKRKTASELLRKVESQE
jgi:integrase